MKAAFKSGLFLFPFITDFFQLAKDWLSWLEINAFLPEKFIQRDMKKLIYIATAALLIQSCGDNAGKEMTCY